MSQIVTSDVEKEDRKETECDGEAVRFFGVLGIKSKGLDTLDKCSNSKLCPQPRSTPYLWASYLQHQSTTDRKKMENKKRWGECCIATQKVQFFFVIF